MELNNQRTLPPAPPISVSQANASINAYYSNRFSILKLFMFNFLKLHHASIKHIFCSKKMLLLREN